MFIADQGCVLRRTETGEDHHMLTLFLRGNGLKQALVRVNTRPGRAPDGPGLFEIADLTLEQKDPARPVFLRESLAVRRFPGLARGYESLKAASFLARFYERNLAHMEHFEAAWELVVNALGALETAPRPEIVLLKTCYLFARGEGYPVNAGWLQRLPPAVRQRVAGTLRQPAGEADGDRAAVQAWLDDLCRFLAQETDLLPPGY